jgi:hypothetical protein
MPDDVWVIWSCGGCEDTARVRDLSLEGLFIETRSPSAIGAEVHLEFLNWKGQIRAEAVVRRVEPSGLGLKFTAINDEDRPHMISLIDRFRSWSE